MADMLSLSRPLLLVGCGKMGKAMLDGWRRSGIAPYGITIVDPMAPDDLSHLEGVSVVSDISQVSSDLDPEVVVLAVKPQQMDGTLSDYRRFAKPDCLFVSIAAGKTIAYFEAVLGEDAAIVRSMPNTPAAIGQGITVACPNGSATQAQALLAEALLRAVGDAVTVTDESLLDAVTALSGGGPAYTFLLIETMTNAGTAAGLPEELAAKLALQTVAGSGQLALQGSEPPARLRENVTSPGGTTLEALKVLMSREDGLPSLMTRAIAAATARSKELGQG